MNESSQIAAMAAELRAHGYDVKQDVPATSTGLSSFENAETFVIDMVASRTVPSAPEVLETLFVEIANRQTRPYLTRSARRFRLPEILSEEEAVSRFKQLAEACYQNANTDLEVRFLDVSADQASARSLEHARISRTDVEQAVRRDYAVWRSVSGLKAEVRATVLALVWSRALRLVAWRHPGRRRRELKFADLRTIQKDLYDYKILTLPPARYRKSHRAIMAIVEGGTFSCEAVLALEGELLALWRWASDQFDLQPVRPERPSVTDLFEQLLRDVRERAPSEQRDKAENTLVLMRLVEGAPAFPALVAELHREIDLRTLSGDAFNRLIEMLPESD